MRGNSHVRFLGGNGAAMRRSYPTPARLSKASEVQDSAPRNDTVAPGYEVMSLCIGVATVLNRRVRAKSQACHKPVTLSFES